MNEAISPEQAHRHIDKFNPYYDLKTGRKSKDVPENTMLTVWIEKKHAFMINDLDSGLGIYALIATSWIAHKELCILCELTKY